MKTYGKQRKKNYLHRTLFVFDDGSLLSLHLPVKRVRSKIIRWYYAGNLTVHKGEA